MIEDKFGKKEGVYITNPLDTWNPAASGSSARVFFGRLQQNQNSFRPAAIKIMRPDQSIYALPLFIEEIKILKKLNDIPGVTQMIEMGFIRPDDENRFPGDLSTEGCNDLTGQVVRYEADENINYEQIEDWASLGWLPYIALQMRSYQHNLFALCDRYLTRQHKPLEISQALEASIQICETFSEAHKRNITYLDHKIVHYYWYKHLSRAYVTDWNVGKIHTELNKSNKTFDIVQFGARTLYFMFAGRIAPASLSLKPTTPDDIMKIPPIGYETNWGHDDNNIPDSVKEVISSTLSGKYSDFNELKADLEACKG